MGNTKIIKNHIGQFTGNFDINLYNEDRKTYKICGNEAAISHNIIHILQLFDSPRKVLNFILLTTYLDTDGHIQLMRPNKRRYLATSRQDLCRLIKDNKEYSSNDVTMRFITECIKKKAIIPVQENINGTLVTTYYANVTLARRVRAASEFPVKLFGELEQDMLDREVIKEGSSTHTDLTQLYWENTGRNAKKSELVKNEFNKDSEEYKSEPVDISSMTPADQMKLQGELMGGLKIVIEDEGRFRAGVISNIEDGDYTNAYAITQSSVTGGWKSEDIAFGRCIAYGINVDDPEIPSAPKEISIRKRWFMENVISKLPKPTILLETSKGYQGIYSIEPSTPIDVWKSIQNKFYNRMFPIGDIEMNSTNALIHIAGTMENNDNDQPFQVKLIEANHTNYTFASFESLIDDMAPELGEICESVQKKYPFLYGQDTKTDKQTKNMNLRSQSNITSEDLSRRQSIISAISRLEDIPRLKIHGITPNHSRSHALELIRSQNILDIFNINVKPGTLFNCFLHNDNYPSAVVFKNMDKRTGEPCYRMLCHSNECSGRGGGHGIDLIDIVRCLSGCNYQTAFKYLCRNFGIENIAEMDGLKIKLSSTTA